VQPPKAPPLWFSIIKVLKTQQEITGSLTKEEVKFVQNLRG